MQDRHGRPETGSHSLFGLVHGSTAIRVFYLPNLLRFLLLIIPCNVDPGPGLFGFFFFFPSGVVLWATSF